MRSLIGGAFPAWSTHFPDVLFSKEEEDPVENRKQTLGTESWQLGNFWGLFFWVYSFCPENGVEDRNILIVHSRTH